MVFMIIRQLPTIAVAPGFRKNPNMISDERILHTILKRAQCSAKRFGLLTNHGFQKRADFRSSHPLFHQCQVLSLQTLCSYSLLGTWKIKHRESTLVPYKFLEFSTRVFSWMLHARLPGYLDTDTDTRYIIFPKTPIGDTCVYIYIYI